MLYFSIPEAYSEPCQTPKMRNIERERPLFSTFSEVLQSYMKKVGARFFDGWIKNQCIEYNFNSKLEVKYLFGKKIPG